MEKTSGKRRERVALAGILLLAAVLSVYGIWNQGYSNEFYAASVKSMLTSWKNFFFVSLDPGGWITVDKPPVSLWVQAAFAKVLGFHGWSIILPQCLAAVGAVFVLYCAVKRHFGRGAGLLSALVLSLSPIFIVVSKTNNTDSILIFFMVLSAWALSAAAEKGSLRLLLLSAALLGVAYNAKTLEAFLILPALLAVYFFASDLTLRRRILHLLAAGVVLAAVSLSWSVAVDLTPASLRPHVDNSSTNSELELALGYNGMQRITGQNSTGSLFGSSAQGGAPGANISGGNAPSGSAGGNSGATPGQGGFGGGNNASGRNGAAGGFGGRMNGGTGGGNSFNGGGSASPLRLFNTTLGGQDSWLLPFGLFSMIALAVGTRRAAKGEGRRKRLAHLLLWGLSVLTMCAYFSVANFFHPYYLSAMAPFLAGLVGIGAAEMWRLYREKTAAGWLLPAALAVTFAVQVAMLSSYPVYAKVLIPLLAVLTGVTAALLAALRLLGRGGSAPAAACAALAFAGLLVSPAVWTGYSVFTGSYNASIPSAGPSAGQSALGAGGRGFAGGMRGTSGASSSSVLASFLLKNNTGEKWLAAVSGSSEAEPLILATGKPVIAIGGFSGNVKTLTVVKLEQLVKSGQLKYFLVSSRGAVSDEVTAWVEKNGKAVDSSKWGGDSSSGNGMSADGRGTGGTLYDLSSYKTAS
jgi:4-amino-4-deoxy-L-arabinose transferase-like glycosyltransferase